MTGPNKKGSSPRMRGAHYAGHAAGIAGGIIPADAGSTIGSLTVFGLSWDHPRGCGEHAIPASLLALTVGSSPRMRGALQPWR